MRKDDDMQTPPFKYEWNLNSILTGLSIAIILVGGVTAYNTTASKTSSNEADIQTIKLDMSAHNQRISENKTLVTQVQAELPRITDRIAQSEKAIENVDARYDRLADAVEQLRSDISNLATQTELTRQILLRMEATQNNILRQTLEGQILAPTNGLRSENQRK